MQRSTLLHWIQIAGLTVVVSGSVTAYAASTERQLEQLQIRIERLERASDNQGVFEMQRQMNSMDQEIQDLRGELERLRFELDEIKAHQREMFIAVDKRLKEFGDRPEQVRQPEQVGETQASPTGQASTTVVSHPDEPDATTSSGSTTDASAAEITEEYKNAFVLLKQREYEQSIAAFSAFLAKYPNSKYSGNAQYWIAEAKYVSKQYESALTEFKKVVENYPESGKVPDAKLKIGFTYYEMERWEDARTELSRLKSQYPNSTVAELAQQRLERMTREGH